MDKTISPKALACFAGLSVCLLVAAPARPCSIFAVEDGQLVLASNNEDYMAGDFDTGIWFVPPEGGDFGFAVVGYTTWEGHRTFSAQGGVNDQGLFLDGNAAPLLEARTNPEGRRGTGWDLFSEPLKHCSTVQEALDLYATFDLTGVINRAKIFIADRHGDAAIFEGDWTTHKAGRYLISTNFYESNPDLGGFPCWRYESIEALLSLSVPYDMDYVARAAESASHDGTYYTNIHDLNANTFRLYYRHDFGRPLDFDLAEEFAGTGGVVLMADLFGPRETDERGEIEFLAPFCRLPGRLAVILRDAGPNQSPTLRDRVQVTLESPGGDSETILLTEILADQGIFVGSLSAEYATLVPGDGRLQAASGDSLVVRYHDLDPGDGTPVDVQAETTVVCDRDHDGHDNQACGGTDCFDLRADFHPAATEFCDAQDDDCDQVTDESCTACDTAGEPDLTPIIQGYNPIACGQCYEGDFDEPYYRDEGHYREWYDAYEIQVEAGQTVVTSVYRQQPNGILVHGWVSSLSEVVASDSGYGALVHTFAEAGTYVLVMALQRVNPAMEPNTYRLELDCLSEDPPPEDGGVDGTGPDGGLDADGGADASGDALADSDIPDGSSDPDEDDPDGGTGPSDVDGETAESGCGCSVQTGQRVGGYVLWGLLALVVMGRIRRRP